MTAGMASRPTEEQALNEFLDSAAGATLAWVYRKLGITSGRGPNSDSG